MTRSTSRGSGERGRGSWQLVICARCGGSARRGQSPVLDPIDAQKWVDQGVLTWADYLPVPDRKVEFYDPDSVGSQVQYRTAIILVDYPDQPFLITQAPGSHPFGNPQPGWTPVAQEDVNEWMYDYYADAEPIQRLQDPPRLLDGGHARPDRHRRRGLRSLQDGREVSSSTGWPPTSTPRWATRRTRSAPPVTRATETSATTASPPGRPTPGAPRLPPAASTTAST